MHAYKLDFGLKMNEMREKNKQKQNVKERNGLPDLFFQYLLYSIHAPTAKMVMHTIVPKIVPATAPLQVAASADIVELALSIVAKMINSYNLY